MVDERLKGEKKYTKAFSLFSNMGRILAKVGYTVLYSEVKKITINAQLAYN